ncbi:septum formation inhibitor Maf [Intrasporangium oryzae NRRL B-24470]|uniref:Nucleoside triphosphate pyrophosphatase n=1 Tax=Intrasporangium oryzae NRRL B-24470 TaxID=1386089 RepID=W9G8C6_9MICO|nr:nucleoside triphosphate pyrophosphatase [Intrasporangium oryzae]EWT00114.1 septum formation inhibitor Maf [Intrasporangium oryzae NRRL B-24470]
MPPSLLPESAPVTLVLASASPARRTTLRAAGVEPLIMVSDVDEDLAVAEALERYGRLDPADVALLLARAKAEDVASRSNVSALVLGCDSVLELDGEVHGKPADPAEAVTRWRRMRGRSGVLHTGHWLVDDREDGAGATLGATASTTVHFAKLSDTEIESYVATGEPLVVAGAFTVDGLGGAFVTAIEGDYHNVVGLSLPLLRELLADAGVEWFDVVGGVGASDDDEE